jgi:1-deoxy-D-xylulose-5-phosphate reductoisomerase
MRLPIQYALAYPDRISIPDGSRRLAITEMGSLQFEPLDEGRYPCFRLAREAAAKGETYPAVLNAADEVAVDLFLNERVSFTRIAEIVDSALQRHQPTGNPGLDDLFAADAWARETARDLAAVRS